MENSNVLYCFHDIAFEAVFGNFQLFAFVDIVTIGALLFYLIA